MTEQLHYEFAGTTGLVNLTGCEDIADFFPSVFQNWPFERTKGETHEQETLFTVERTPDHFNLASQIFDTNQNLKDPLNITCSLVAQLAWARLRHSPGMLCFHGAAIEVNGALVLFPNKRRAGKSTLTACLATLGYRVFTDDYLLIEIDEDGVMYGHANGAALRLRLPLPEEFSPELVNEIQTISGSSNAQYLYLNPQDGTLAKHGERLPISTIVMLERESGHGMKLQRAGSADILQRVILQNFSRHMNPARILGMIDHLVASTRGFEFRYESAEVAAQFLANELEGMPDFDHAGAYGKPPELAAPDLCVVGRSLPFDPMQKYIRSNEVVERDHETDCFVASTHGARIHHMDLLARAIWNLLREPTNLDEIVDVFRSAFPDNTTETLRRDIGKSLSKFAAEGLLLRADKNGDVR